MLQSAHVIDGEKLYVRVYCGVRIVGLCVLLSARQKTLTLCFWGSKGGRRSEESAGMKDG